MWENRRTFDGVKSSRHTFNGRPMLLFIITRIKPKSLARDAAFLCGGAKLRRYRLTSHRVTIKWTTATVAWGKKVHSDILHVCMHASYLESVMKRSFTACHRRKLIFHSVSNIAQQQHHSIDFGDDDSNQEKKRNTKNIVFWCVRERYTYLANDGQLDGAPGIGCPMHKTRSKVSCDDATEGRHKNDANSFETKISND